MNALGLACITLLGLFVPDVRGQGMGGLGPMGMLMGLGGGEMMGGGGMRDMMMLSALAGGMQRGGGRGGSGSSPDLATMMLLSQQGGGGMGNMQDMLPLMAMMGSGSQSQTPSTGIPTGVSPPMGGQGTGAATSMAAGMAQMLGNSGNNITPAQQQSLWRVVQAAGQTQNIMEAVTSPSDKLYLEQNGISSVTPMMRVMMCPRQTNCQFVFCGSERPVMLYTPESFYVCQGCPNCPLDGSARRMQNMMRMFRQQAGAGRPGAAGVTAPVATAPMPMRGPPAGMMPPRGMMPPAGMMHPRGMMPPAGMMPPRGMMGMMPPSGMMPGAGRMPRMTPAMMRMLQQQMAGGAPAGMPPMPPGFPQQPTGQPPVPPPTGQGFPPPPTGLVGPPPPYPQTGPPSGPPAGGDAAMQTMPVQGMAPPAGFVRAVENMGRRLQNQGNRKPGPPPPQETSPP